MVRFIWVLAAVCITFAVQSSKAVAQELYQAIVTLDIVNNEVTPEVFGPLRDGVREELSILPDNVFAKVDMRVIIDEATTEYISKMVDQGFTEEPSGCAPGRYGPMDMHQGLRYFLDVVDRNPKQVQFSFYPGDKTTNWANSVYCEFDETLGDEKAVMRFTGFFHVRHRELPTGLDLIFSAFPVSPEQAAIFAN